MILFWQIYFALGIAVLVLPFLIEKGTPKSWHGKSFAYRILLAILVVVLWPVSIAAFCHAVYKIVQAYARFQNIIRQAAALAVDDIMKAQAEAAQKATKI